jgi:antitoxin HicB
VKREMFEYPVVLKPDEEGGYVVTFPDVPEAITQGEDVEEAMMYAVDALETALEFYVEGRRPLPVPSKGKAERVVRLGVLTCAKLGVYQAMLEGHVGKAELARRLHWHLPQVDRLLDLGHASKVDQIEAAYAALGKRLVVSMAEAA